MTSNGGSEEDFFDMWSPMEFALLEQLLSVEDFPMAEPSNDGDHHPGGSGAQSNNAEAPDQQDAQTTVATLYTQDNSNRTLESFPAFNLKSDNTTSILKKTEATLSKGQVDRQTCEAFGLRKFKPTSVPFRLLRIGTYEVRPRYKPDLIAKWYYTKKQLSWEILKNGLKNKIEISWSDISAIRVKYDGDVEILEIELYNPPHFYHETKIIAKKHTSWKPSFDFTDGQACTYRRHYLEFPQGTLHRNMEPLFFLDSRLRELAKMPFSSWGSPFFMGYGTDAPQSAPLLINSELIQLHRHLHHPLPTNHSSVPTCSADDELMNLIQEYERQLVNHQMPSLKISPASQISDYGYAPSSLLPINATIFNGQLMGHSPVEQLIAPSSYNLAKDVVATSHGHEGYPHNSNLNMMMATNDFSYTSAGINAAPHAHMWNDQAVFNQEMGHHSRLASSSNAPGMDITSNSCNYPMPNNHPSQRSHEEYKNNNEPCINKTGSHHVHAQDGLIYPELPSNHNHDHQDHRFIVGYDAAYSFPNEYTTEDEVRKGSCFGGDKPPYFMP